MHLKRYKTKMGYKYMILEPGTNTCLVNLGCIRLREAQSELRKWSTEEQRQAALTKYHLQDETLLFTARGSLKFGAGSNMVVRSRHGREISHYQRTR